MSLSIYLQSYSVNFFLKKKATQGNFGGVGNISYLGHGDSMKFICVHPNSSNCTQCTKYKYMQFSVYQLYLNKTVRKTTLDHYLQMLPSQVRPSLNMPFCFISPLIALFTTKYSICLTYYLKKNSLSSLQSQLKC